jgi:hypothetical protein
MSKIIKNACRCKKCGTYLESTHRHDYRTCPCGVMVDGGKDYVRRGWPCPAPPEARQTPDDWIEELSEYEGE